MNYITIPDYYGHILEWQANRRTKPPMVFSALEAVDGAMWLIAGFRYAQALTSLSTCIELLLKAELLQYGPSLIDRDAKLNAIQIKDLLHKGKRPPQQPFCVPDYTISAKESFRRTNYIPAYQCLLDRSKQGIYRLFQVRNETIHSGSDVQEEGRYADLIASVAIPFIDSFLALSNGISLEKLLTPGVHRELAVARKVCARLKEENRQPEAYSLVTTAFKVTNTFVPRPTSEGDRGHSLSVQEELLLSNEIQSEVSSDWADGDWIVEWCQVCDSVQTYVKVRPYVRPNRGLLPVAVRCPKCGLRIDEDDEYLAEYHVQVRDEVIAEFFENGFYPEDYDVLDLDRLKRRSPRSPS